MTRVDHRPWPLPASTWVWRQTWHDLLFIHWPVPPAILKPLIPPGVTLDTRDGDAWVTLAPFRMTGVTLRGIPALPWISEFPEMNLRTYVTAEQKPGVFFLRMDAGRALAVWAARMRLSLPYVWSNMTVVQCDDRSVDYRSRNGAAVFDATYRPTSDAREPAPGSLDAFLVERYCLYTNHAHNIWRVNIHHQPWPLQPAVAEIRIDTIPNSIGLPPPGSGAIHHVSRRLDVVGWGREAISRSSV